MDVKKGFKQTEVGMIPKDWNLIALGRLVRSVDYGSATKSSNNGLVPVLRMGNLQCGKIDWSDLVYTSDAKEICKYALRPGDVLFNRTNTIDLVGKTSLYDGTTPAIFAGYLIRVNVHDELLDSRFLNLVLNTEFARRHSAKVLSVAVGQANINGQKLKTYPIPLPPTLGEQKAIAEAIADADAWIESLEELIAKKRQIKQGAMQELLTGNRRLPGFSGKWGELSVGEIADVKTGPFGSSLHERDYVTVGTPIITVEHLGEVGVTYANLPQVSSHDCDRLSNYRLELNDIVFSRVGSVDRNALIREEEVGWLFSGRLLRLRFDIEKVHPPFLSQLFHSSPFKLRVYAVAVGQTMACLNTRIVNALRVMLPSFDEQIAIADILTAIDTEITELQTKLSKARQIKQGMMQELLTGRIRLVKPTASSAKTQEAVHAC